MNTDDLFDRDIFVPRRPKHEPVPPRKPEYTAYILVALFWIAVFIAITVVCVRESMP